MNNGVVLASVAKPPSGLIFVCIGRINKILAFAAKKKKNTVLVGLHEFQPILN